MNTAEPSAADLAKMQAIQQKRTLAFVNHCVMTNVQCLNNFMQVCEDKLMQFEEKLDRVDAAMVLLESKLLSIPEVNTIATESKDTSETLEPISDNQPGVDNKADNTDSSTENSRDVVTIHQPEYDRFVKMVQVGVPLQAAKMKCALEGLDPEVLEGILGK